MASEGMQPRKSKVVAGVLGILLGVFGIHKFYLGYTGAGIVHLVLLILLFTAPVSAIIGLIEGILYLVRTDEDFYETYEANKRAWF